MTAFVVIDNRSSRRLRLSLSDAHGRPAGEPQLIGARARARFPAVPLVIGANYNLTGTHTGCPTPGDFNFTMVEGLVIRASYTSEGPIYNVDATPAQGRTPKALANDANGDRPTGRRRSS